MSTVTERSVFLVLSNPSSAERAEEFDAWYGQVHLPEILALPGVLSARRLAHRPTSVDAGGEPSHRFAAIYEVEGDPEAFLKSLNTGIADGDIQISDLLDLSTTSMSLWSPIDSVIPNE